MQDEPAPGTKLEDSNRLFLIIALCAVAASTMIVEIVIVKFVAFKLFHHFISVIVSTVVLSFAAAGTFLYMRAGEETDPQLTWRKAAREAAIYSIALMLAIVFFSWLPIDPYNKQLAAIWRIGSLPIYFIIFSVPFFFGGLCISRVLAERSLRPSRVLLFDLTSAAIAAAIAPALLELLGGYGAIGAAAALGLLAFFCFEKASGKIRMRQALVWSTLFVLGLCALLAYPTWAFSTYGVDVRTGKGQNLSDIILHELHGFKSTYWNALARIDVSNTGWSKEREYLYGMAPHTEPLEGRLITVDKGANTRQFANKGKLSDQAMFGESILATPYVLRPDDRNALIIGGGGGLDITVAKYLNIPNIDVVEMNPMTYKHVLLGEGDPERNRYQPWITSDDKSNVRFFNKEARHYCSTAEAHSYDSIQATGVDSFTAIASGALAYADNYLYTADAVKSYLRLLKPNGVLSLAYCRSPESLPIRLFVTYLECIEDSGSKEPWRNVVVIGHDLSDVVVSPTPFTEGQLQRLRQWCTRTGKTLIFDPGRRSADTPGLTPEERIYTALGFAQGSERQKLINDYPKLITATTDDRPFYFRVERTESWLFSSNYSYTPVAAIVLIALVAASLVILPLKKIGLKDFSAGVFARACFFAMCGFAFLLFEVSLMQLFSVFVGGPAYSLAVVLVSVLAGYSIGCFAVPKLPMRSSTFLFLGAALCAANMAAYFLLPPALISLLGLSVPERIVFCSAVTLVISALAGLPVPLAMESAKQDLPRELTWFWGISCAFNALGAACFPLITYQIGIKATLCIVAVLYLSACVLMAAIIRVKVKTASANDS